MRAVPVRKTVTSSWAAPAAVAPYRAAASGQGHRARWPFNHDRTHRSIGTCGPSQSGRLQVGRPPLLLHSHGTGSRPGTGQSHRAGGPFKLYSPRSRSLAGSPADSVNEALARTGRPSQKDFKLGGPRCSDCCTVPDRHRTGPSGRRAIIQSAVTVPGSMSAVHPAARIGPFVSLSSLVPSFGFPRASDLGIMISPYD